MEKNEMLPLLIVKQNSVILEAFNEMDAVSKANRERYMFIKKQIEAMKAEDDAAERKFWKVAEKEMSEKDICKEGPFILRDGVIYKGDDRPNGLSSLLALYSGDNHELIKKTY